MPNANRAAGDYLERSARAALDAHGWQTIRAAGSLGVADLWAARAGTLLMVSCKTNGTMGPAERDALRAAATTAGGIPVMAYRAARGWIALAIVDGTPHPHLWDQLKVPKKHTGTTDDAPP